jgi:hypothetical protein
MKQIEMGKKETHVFFGAIAVIVNGVQLRFEFADLLLALGKLQTKSRMNTVQIKSRADIERGRGEDKQHTIYRG